MIDDLLAARLQMAISLAFHIIFAVIGIGMPVLMCIAQWRWFRTGSTAAEALAKHWARGTAVFFAVGAVSGTVLSFELGLLWPGFMEHAGGVIGLPFGLEGFAFFTEAIFLGIYLYGWGRIPRWAHLGAGVVVAISGVASAVFVVMANAWMNTPVGFDFDPAAGDFTNIDPIAAMFNPAWKAQVLHMVVAAYMATGFGAAGVHALQLLRNRESRFHRTGILIAMAVGGVAAVVQPISGDYASKVVAATQPAKLAAMEGQFETERRAPLRIGGLPDEEDRVTRYAVEIPGLLSFLSHGDWDAEVTGLNDIPRENWPPVAITHLAFQFMVGCGVVMLAVALWFGLAAWRARGAPTGRWLLRAVVLCAPLGFLAIQAGWVVTEVGRQPWIIQGVMRVEDAVTPMPGIWIPMITFTGVYLLLGVIVASIIAGQVRRSRASGPGEAADA